MASAVYAGSFDPPTVGHVSILFQAASVFDKICILVATNPDKAPMFTAEDRVRIWEDIVETYNLHPVDVQILPPNEYTVRWAADEKFTHLIRGLRSASDLEDETVVRDINRLIHPLIGTVYFMTAPSLRAVSSSIIKGLIGPKGWHKEIKDLVPHASWEALMRVNQC